MQEPQQRDLRLVLLRVLNEKQILILSNIDGISSITYLLGYLSERWSIPLSTLKLNARILRSMKLIEYANAQAQVTPTGRLVLRMMLGDTNVR